MHGVASLVLIMVQPCSGLLVLSGVEPFRYFHYFNNAVRNHASFVSTCVLYLSMTIF